VTVLEQMLGTVSPESFHSEYWDRKPLHVRGEAGRFATLYDAATWQTFEGVDNLKAATQDADGFQVETPILREQAGMLFMAGFTICADVSTTPQVAPFLDAFKRAFDLPGVGGAFAKLYASSHGKGFAVHADKHHVFVLQVSGKKLWRYSRTPVVADAMDGLFIGRDGQPYWTSRRDGDPALRDDGSLVPPPDLSTFDSALLEPGDMLYLPPGTWHVARAEGHSIAVSISPDRTTVLDLVTRVVHELFSSRPEWRRDVLAPAGQAPPPGAVAPAVAEQLEARLGELRAAIAGLDARRLYRLWSRDVAEAHATEAVAPPAPVGEDIRRSDVFVRATDEPFHFIVAPVPDGDEENCFFYCQGGEWSFPGAARAFLTKLEGCDEVRAEDALAWDRTLKFQQVREMLATLVAAGVLRRR
jgi:ribosomal protein L16 Arg81 hydroxylase